MYITQAKVLVFQMNEDMISKKSVLARGIAKLRRIILRGWDAP